MNFQYSLRKNIISITKLMDPEPEISFINEENSHVENKKLLIIV